MTFNWGLALGKALETGLNTYERLGEEETRELQRRRLRQEIAQEEEQQQFLKDTYGRVGAGGDYTQNIGAIGGIDTQGQQAKQLAGQSNSGDAAFDRALAQSTANTLYQNRRDVPNAAQNSVGTANIGEGNRTPTQAIDIGTPQGGYTEAQAAKDYVAKLRGTGNIKGIAAAYQLKALGRESDFQDKFDAAITANDERNKQILDIAHTGSLEDAYKLAKENGLNVDALREGNKKDGKVIGINVLGPDGKPTQHINNTQQAAEALLEENKKKFVETLIGLTGDPTKAGTLLHQAIQNRTAERKVKLEEEYNPARIEEAKAKALYYRDVAGRGNKDIKPFSQSDIQNGLVTYGKASTQEPKPGGGFYTIEELNRKDPVKAVQYLIPIMRNQGGENPNAPGIPKVDQSTKDKMNAERDKQKKPESKKEEPKKEAVKTSDLKNYPRGQRAVIEGHRKAIAEEEASPAFQEYKRRNPALFRNEQ